jgi:outer membrane protein TolC
MRPVAALLASLSAALAVCASEPPLALDQAVALALERSKEAKLAQLRVSAAHASADAALDSRYPRVDAFGLSSYFSEPIDLKVREGALTPLLDGLGDRLGLGSLSAAGPFPPSDLTLVHGDYLESIGGVSMLQPLTQLWRIESGVRAARADLTGAQRGAARAALQIRVAVEQLYAGLNLEGRHRALCEARVAQAERRLKDAENAQRLGELLDDSVLGLRAELIEARSDLTRSDQQRARLMLRLADLIGRPGTTELALALELPEREAHPLEYWLEKVGQNPDRQVAAAVAEKAQAGVSAAKLARIPEVSAFLTGYAQDGMPLVPDRGAAVGLTLHWNVFDFGRTKSEIARSLAEQRLAETNRDRLEDEASREIRETYQDYLHGGELVALAEQAVAYRARASELARQNASTGLALEAKALAAEADLRKAEYDLAGARIQRHLALLNLYSLIGE